VHPSAEVVKPNITLMTILLSSWQYKNGMGGRIQRGQLAKSSDMLLFVAKPSIANGNLPYNLAFGEVWGNANDSGGLGGCAACVLA